MTNRQPDRAPAALTLDAFLLARIAEDEAAAQAVPPLDHNYDMGGNRQDERWIFDRTLPSSADGMGNWSNHRHSPTTAEHFSRHDPARVLAECEAKRGAIEAAWSDHERIEGEWGMGKSREQMGAEDDNPAAIEWLALPYAEHPDYREEWRP